MKASQTYKKGIFLSRTNRFVVRCSLKNKKVNAYLPNPGRLRELLLRGSILYLVTQPSSVKFRFMVVAVEKDGAPVLLHTHLNNTVARFLIENSLIAGLEGAVIVRPEVTIGHSRFDFLLCKGNKEIVLEVKCCTLFSGGTAMFPDAPTLRGQRHLSELASLSGGKQKAAVLFIVHSPRVHFFLPDYHTDLAFARTLLSVSEHIMVKAVSVRWNRDLSLGLPAGCLSIPWDLIRREARDRGSYIVILHLQKSRKIVTGGLGSINFRKGYYLYVGSAKNNLSKRITRHQRTRKNLFWHIDYLREHAEFHASLPVRASDDLECELAAALQNITQRHVPGFGCSDCTCKSHLFWMSYDPFLSPLFIKTLMYFRIERLERELNMQYPSSV